MIAAKTKVIVLGSGVCVPSAKRNAPGYYMQCGDENFLIDSGSGTLHSLAVNGIDYSKLDAVFYTHFHIDHIADMEPLLFAFKNDPLVKRENPLKLYGSVGLKALVDNYFNKVGQDAKPLSFDLEVIEIKDGDNVQLESCSAEAKHVKHTDNSVGYRFTTKDGKVIVFSGDSGKCQALVDLAKDADLAIFEASGPEEFFEPNNIETHLSASWAGQLAEQAGVKKLVLSHIYPATDQFPLVERCKKFFSGEVVLAEDNMAFDV